MSIVCACYCDDNNNNNNDVDDDDDEDDIPAFLIRHHNHILEMKLNQ